MAGQGTARAALSRGLATVWRWPGDVATAWAVSLALSIPLAVAMHSILGDSIGASEAGQRLVTGWDGLWFRTFEAQATGLGKSFGPGVVGIGAVLRGLDAMITVGLSRLSPTVLAAGGLYALSWVMLSGGLIARYLAQQQPPSLLRASVEHVSRLLPLALVVLGVHVLAFTAVYPWVSGLVERALRDVIDERVAIGWAVVKYGSVWLMVGAVGLVHGYAKIALVSGRASTTVGALAWALAFVRRRPGAVLGLAAGLLGAFVAFVAVYWAVAPGATDNNAFRVLVAFAIGQGSIMARIGLRCWGHAARVALVEST